jgi:HK97 family phage portal protein
MGVLSTMRALLGREPVERRDASFPLSSPGLAALWGLHPHGATVSAQAAENLASIASAVGAISSALASLQPISYRRDGTGRSELPGAHWLARLLRQPAPRMSWPDWIEVQVAAVLLSGNALAVIEADAGGRITALHPVAWGSVSMWRLPSGRIAYDVTDTPGTWGRAGAVHRFLESEVWHLRDRCDPGELAARPRLVRAAGAVRNAVALQDMAASVWDNAARISGYVAAPQPIPKPQRDEAQAWLDSFKGARAAGGTPILPNGWKWESVQIDAESLQTIESRKFSVIEVARIFNVPPPLLQSYENNTFTNAAQASLWFGQFTLGPWARKIEAALQIAIVGAQSDLSVELDLSSLLRGSHAERWQANEIAIRTGVLSPDEVRAQEGWGPRRADQQQQQENGNVG